MQSMTHRVFVYGTLKRGFWNHYLLEGCELFGSAATVPTYKMIENGFPVVMPDPEGKPVAGEIYTVDDETLERLDQLEREGSSYDRRLIDVTLPLASGERLPTFSIPKIEPFQPTSHAYRCARTVARSTCASSSCPRDD